MTQLKCVLIALSLVETPDTFFDWNTGGTFIFERDGALRK